MAIQNRRGAYGDFDPAKMVPGEFAVVQENDPENSTGRTLYLCYGPGVVKRIADQEDLDDVKYLVSGNTDKCDELTYLTGKNENDITRLKQVTEQLDADMMGKVDGGYVEDGVAYFTSNGEVLFSITGIGGGGGGGGSSTNAVLTVTNTTGWITTTIADGNDCPVKVTWSSIENDMPTGNGTATINVNGLVKGAFEVEQGKITINLKQYIGSGINKVRISISDVYGQTKSVNFNISVITLRITSSFDTATPFEGVIPFPYTPIGDVAKTVYFYLDGNLINTQETSVSGRQLTYTIPAQVHGGHNLRVYYESTVNEQTVRSNELYYEFISLEKMNSTPIIISSFNTANVDQYESVRIPYRVYTPTSDSTEIKLYVNGSLVSSQTVDRTEQVFTFRADTPGEASFKIVAGKISKTITFTVVESSIDVEAETEDLALYLTAQGRSNNEETRDVWKSGDVAAAFSGFTWRLDGWQKDGDGIDVLRLNDKARLTIPYQIFGRDFKSTGKTIEVEFATRDVVDYDAVILSCFADNIGLKITSQSVYFAGAQTNTNTLYKDNEHIRLSIVVEKQTDNRLILIYINGIMSRAIQYASGERFSQLNPVGITLGSDDCGIDIYNIRVYDNNLTRKQILTNWIADTQIGSVMLERYNHNNVYDAADNIPIANLPKDLPYMILEAEELPQFKGDKKTVKVTYTDPIYSTRSFTAEGVQANVQGTSSAPYYRKNYDLQFKSGFVSNSGESDTYALRQGSIPFNRFVLKADVASSESTNNTGLTMFYHDTCPYKTPEMKDDPRVRWGIEGIPIVVYWYDTGTQTTNFLGKYNFNLPKRAPTPLGYSGNMQSWEWQRNNSDNVKFKDDDFTSTYFDNDQQTYVPNWYQDFEARMPSDEWRDYAQLKEMISWVKSTAREQATLAVLESPVTYTLSSDVTITPYADDKSFTDVKEVVDGSETGRHIITFTKDTPAYRLSKFRAELDDYFERESVLFYYLFTELFLMIDSRAKNMFIGFRGGDLNIAGREMTRKAVIEPYDMDTAVGTNNSGVLMFSYFYEDTDTVSEVISGEGGSNAPVYNAQDSVLWNNVRDAFKPEMIIMYRNLRSSGAWSYNAVETMYEQHQAKWPEAVFNEDAYIKYIVPLVEPVTVDPDTGKLIKTDRYLTMLQGSKAEQRKWWLFNRFKYLDSKYTAGTANTNVISARLFADGAITVTPIVDSYVTVQFGGGNALNIKRTEAGKAVTFRYTAPSGVTEMETYIYSADLISDIGDMSGFYPNEVDFSKATKLRSLKLGDSSASYSNANLRTFDVRNSTLLESIDVRNCPNLAITVNLENSPRLKEAYFDGTSITGAEFADGGSLQKLHLPATITTLTLLNLNQLSDLQVASYANVSRLMLANMDTAIIDPVTVLKAIQPNSQINIQGLYLNVTGADSIEEILALFDTMSGVTREKDANGNWLYYDSDTAVVSGEIHTGTLTGAQIASYKARYPYINFTADHTSSVIYFYNGSTLITQQTVLDGGDATYSGSTPTKTQDAQYTYSFAGWSMDDDNTVDSDALIAVTADRNVYACFTGTIRTYTVTWVNNGTTIETDTNVPYGTIPHYDGATPTKDGQTSTGWLPDPTVPITGSTTFTAQYLPVYTITFKNDTGTTTLDTQNVVQGGTATYGGTTPTSSEDASLAWLGWATSANSHTANAVLTNIQASATVYAAFESAVEVAEITDSWDKIIANIDNGTYATKYKVGNYKPLDLGTEGTINMQIVAMDADELADGSGYAPLTFLGMELLNTPHVMASTTQTTVGWETSDMRTYLNEDILTLFPAVVRNRINSVVKPTYYGSDTGTHNVVDKLWLPSAREVVGKDFTYVEKNGVRYDLIYTGNTSRIKTANSSGVAWWLRSSGARNFAARYKCIDASGSAKMNGQGVQNRNYICLGFCLGLSQE